MSITDILIAVAVIIGFLLGYKDGFVRKIIGLTGFVAAIVLASLYAFELGGMIERVFDIEIYFARIMGGIIIFLTVVLIASIIKRLVHPFDKVNNFVNQLAGGIAGAIQILFFAGAAIYLLNIFDIPNQKEKENSIFYSNVFSLIPETVNLLNEYTPATKKKIKEYINDKDSTK
ncbi:MAG: CvpA family protein [Ignavibacteriaceae bacterium]|nr:CvpA family protein [Ignavibacteriaceae bacterium]